MFVSLRAPFLKMAAVSTLLALTAVGGASAASAAPRGAPPVGVCNTGFDLVSVQFILDNTPLTEPDPSMDRNGDGQTCLKLLSTGSGTRAAWHDNVIPGRR
jgi:hypothetical protein